RLIGECPDWNTMPKPVRRSAVRSLAFIAVTSRQAPARESAKWTVPDTGGRNPDSAWSRVVLPEPEGPTTATDSPARITKSMPAKTVVAPCAEVNPRATRMSEEFDVMSMTPFPQAGESIGRRDDLRGRAGHIRGRLAGPAVGQPHLNADQADG